MACRKMKFRKDVPFKGLKKCGPAALQAFEKIRPAKTHEPLAGARQFLDFLDSRDRSAVRAA